MKKKTTIITEEFDKDGNLINKTTETTTEEDGGYIYPQYPVWPSYPAWPTYTHTTKPEWIYRPETTCTCGGVSSADNSSTITAHN